MSAVPKPKKLTVAEYLAIEEKAERKSEFFDGEMFLMAGAAPKHNYTKDNLVGELHGRLRGGPCRTVSSDQRLHVERVGLYTYPDILIICGQREFDPVDPMSLLNPLVIFEILSASTESYDRGAKFRRYQQIPSVREIVLVSTEIPLVQVFARQDDGRWVLSTFDDMDGAFALTSVPVNVPLVDVYRDVEFDVEVTPPQPG